MHFNHLEVKSSKSRAYKSSVVLKIWQKVAACCVIISCPGESRANLLHLSICISHHISLHVSYFGRQCLADVRVLHVGSYGRTRNTE